MGKSIQEVPSFQQAQIYLPTPALPEQLFSISMDMFIFKSLRFIRSTEGEGGINGCHISHEGIFKYHTNDW
jgi:hypothetical protein